MKKQTVFTLDLEFPIELAQTGKDRFTVTYGKQVTARLCYASAARELGNVIMHALACQGKIQD